jgi:hypothetical protein
VRWLGGRPHSREEAWRRMLASPASGRCSLRLLVWSVGRTALYLGTGRLLPSLQDAT